MKLICKFKKSDMTPCVITDGEICLIKDSFLREICVGCSRFKEVIEKEIKEQKVES